MASNFPVTRLLSRNEDKDGLWTKINRDGEKSTGKSYDAYDR